jgi:hypothetical protein
LFFFSEMDGYHIFLWSALPLYKYFCGGIINLSLWKENLKNEGQQFHQYQQNRQPPIASTHKYNNNKKTMTYGNENPCPGFGQAQKCGIIKPIMDGLVVYLLFKSFCVFYRSVWHQTLQIKTITSVLKISAYIITIFT